jgi:orotidine-5'-phosphate decarboxylase
LTPRERLIVALDISSADQARHLVATLGGTVGAFKVGKQLFTSEGPALVRELVAGGHRVFLDLKFHDIPTTVAAAVRAASALGVSMLTVHAAGGSRMLRAAVAAAREAPNPPLVLAVTVLTSMVEEDMHEGGVPGSVVDQVLRLAALAASTGCGGIVTSAREAQEARLELGPGFAIVTPGVRPATGAHGDPDDQVRVVTPAQAIAAGVSHIVVGRPITKAPDPAAVARQVVDEIASVKVNSPA